MSRAKKTSAVTWEQFKEWAMALDLPNVVETTSWGQPTLKAHGKLWAWWSPHENAPVFKMSQEERDFLLQADPDTFFVTPHYAGHDLVLVRPNKLDETWAKARLLQSWRAMAPKRVLKAYDEGRS